ncbi:hypothetical protein Ciccas_009801 [Cichlidogyrus casuarinus]|uniref:Major facilitator superfamily (MFS) profile domain-containing protein n=1 Tax=Cichlidogyrus casuarinus TaxID=1844966 RepID=A0ABD2PW77_9PLAT
MIFQLVKKFLAQSSGSKLDDSVLLYALANAIFVVGAAIGAFMSGWIANILGRRGGLLANHSTAIIGSILVGPCYYMNSMSMFYIGRMFSGLNCGVSSGVASMFLTEIAPRRFRGAIGACHQLAITLGIVASYVITMNWSLNQHNCWSIAYAVGGIPAVISLIILPFCPESPRFLFLRRNNEEAARKAFMKLNHADDADMFIGELREEQEIAKQQPKFRFIKLFVQRDLRMPVILAVLIQVMQQLSGINAVMAYSSQILKTAGIPLEYNQICVVVIGIINVAATIVSLPLIERLGRRALILWPTFGLAWTLLFLVIFVNLVDHTEGSVKKSMGIVSALLIFLYIICFAMGLGPMAGLIVSEIFRTEPRGAAYSLSQCIQWLANLVVMLTFPSVNAAIKGYTFLPFLVAVVCIWVVFFLFMPETKNRTFDEVATDLAFGKIVIGQKRAVIESRPMEEVKGQMNSDRGASEPLIGEGSQAVKV